MKCSFYKREQKECNLHCQYYHTCTRSEYRKKESKEHGGKTNVYKESDR